MGAVSKFYIEYNDNNENVYWSGQAVTGVLVIILKTKLSFQSKLTITLFQKSIYIALTK